MPQIQVLVVLLISSAMYACKPDASITYEEALRNHQIAEKQFRQTKPSNWVFNGFDAFIGARLPDRIGHLISGEVIDDQFVKDKITLLNFWFEGCQPCVDEIPELNAIAERFGKDKFNYIAIGRETDADAIAFIGKHNWQFNPVANGPRVIAEDFNMVWGYPKTIVVGKEGTIASIWSGISAYNFEVFVHHLDSLQQQL